MSGFSQDSMRYITTAAGGGIEAPGSPQYFIAYRDNAAWGSGTYYAIDSSGNIETMFTAGGGIGGGGTLNYIPKFTPDGTHLGNSLLFDNGTSVLFGGTTAIASAGFAITSTSQGFLAPRMTTAQRNAIATPATGLLIYNTSTSLFCYYDGATWQNIDSQAGGDVSGSGTTNYVPLWTDGPNSVLGNSIISYDTNQIGINQATPSATLHVNQTAVATGSPTALRVVTGAHTTLVASTECTSVYFDFSAIKQWQTGAISTQREVMVLAPTYSFVAASTISTAATFAITGAPIAGTNATITTPLALWVSSGESRFVGSGTTSATYALRTYNATPSEIFSVRNDGVSFFGTSATSAKATIYSSNNNHISLSILGGIADRYLLYLNSASENAHYVLNNANHLFYAGAGGAELILSVAGSGVTNGRVSIAPSGSANYLTTKFYVETSLNNDRAIWGKTLGAGGTADYAGYFEAVGAGTLNIGSFFTASGATSNFAIITNAGNIGIGTNLGAIGTNAEKVLAIANGTAPSTSPADMIQIYSVDISAGNASLGLRTETAVVTESVVSDRTLSVTINGTVYKICLKA